MRVNRKSAARRDTTAANLSRLWLCLARDLWETLLGDFLWEVVPLPCCNTVLVDEDSGAYNLFRVRFKRVRGIFGNIFAPTRSQVNHA